MRIISAIFTLVFSFGAFSADLDAIFPTDTKVSEQTALTLSRWLKNNCKDLHWALRVEEIPSKYEDCGSGVKKVHLEIELSHLKEDMIFWIKEDSLRSSIQWIYEEFPAWKVCQGVEAYERRDLSCTP